MLCVLPSVSNYEEELNSFYKNIQLAPGFAAKGSPGNHFTIAGAAICQSVKALGRELDFVV